MSTVDIDMQLLYRGLTSVAPCMSKDETRPSLCATHVMVAGTSLTVEATNGHMLAQFVSTVPAETEAFDVLIPQPQVLALAKLLKAATSGARCGDNMAHLSQDACSWLGGSIEWKFNGDKFPHTAEVIPGKDRPGPTSTGVGLDSDYLADVGKCAKAFRGKGKVCPLTVRLSGALDPARFDAEDLDGAVLTVVVMPIRIKP